MHHRVKISARLTLLAMVGRILVAVSVVPLEVKSAEAVIRAFWNQSLLSRAHCSFHSINLLRRLSETSILISLILHT